MGLKESDVSPPCVCLGNNTYGQAVIVPSFLRNKAKIKQVACGDYHTLILTDDGLVRALGYNRWGQLGLGHTVLSASTPTLIKSLRNIVYIAAGSTHSMAIDGKGALYCWGNGRNGACATQSEDVVHFPRKVTPLIPARSVAGGLGHTVVLLKTGKVVCFGSNTFGQCGVDPAIRTSVTASYIKAIGTTGKEVACGRFHTGIVTKQGKLFMFGAGAEGQLGTAKSAQFQYQTNEVNLGSRVASVACGASHTLALTDEGTVYSFGACSKGQLGIPRTIMNTTNTIFAPQRVDIPMFPSKSQTESLTLSQTNISNVPPTPLPLKQRVAQIACVCEREVGRGSEIELFEMFCELSCAEHDQSERHVRVAAGGSHVCMYEVL
eukprot:CFRG4751T1